MSCFLRVSCYFQHLKKKNSGGGGGVEIFFFSHFTFYAIVNITKNTIEKCPFT